MDNVKLSARAWEVLLAIDERCSEGYGPDKRFWSPASDNRGCDDWCERLGRFVNINGSGDARIIESLRAKGLIEKVVGKECYLNKYSSRITEDGRLAIERALEQGKLPLEVVE